MLAATAGDGGYVVAASTYTSPTITTIKTITKPITTTTKKTTTAAAPKPSSDTDGEWTYDCKGSTMCSQLQVKTCDEAANDRLVRKDDLNYGTNKDAPLGTGAFQDGFHACGVF